ncbi:MAG TPA: polymer-forming cytoskeletal protein [Kiloniellales bacterium]
MFGKNESRHNIDAKASDAAKDDGRGVSAAATPSRVQHSILSADTRLTGDLVSSGDITVEGTIDGSIKCRSLTLVGQPTIKGSVEADTAHVCGTFTGELRANKVILNKTAKMRGDIYQQILEVHTGAEFEGKVARLTASPSQPSASSTSQASNGRHRPKQSEPGVRPLV